MARRPLGTVLLLLGLAATAHGARVQLKTGDIYPDATVVRRDAYSIEIKVRYGTMTLPLDSVAAIDGAPLRPLPPPTPAPTPRPAAAPPRPKPTPAPVLSTTPAPTPIHPPPSATPTPQPATRNPQPAFSFLRLAKWAALAAAVAVGLPVLLFLLYAFSRWRGRRALRPQAEENTPPPPFEFLDADRRPIAIDAASEVASGIENARAILENALARRASDVHIEPAAQECRVRLRIDGAMLPDRAFATADGLRLVSALKTLAQVDIAERRKAQDGRFGARQGTGREVDFRVATVPSVHGEKLVLRILDRKAGVRGLNDLGMPQEMMDRFAQIVHSRSGMILATGPTGSGKTSSLYAALTQLDATRLNLVTIEDPVEYELAGATQIPVNAKAGVTYESGLRSILRQDPDVILVGEMRDLESAQIALRSALTGHLVFSSLHTRDAVGAVMRLTEMGIEPPLVASALFVVLSQRLVRVLCEACRRPYESSGHELAGLGIEFNPSDTLYHPGGCRRCEGTGYLGRTGVFEMLVLDDEIRQRVSAGIEEGDLVNLARQRGFKPYREDGALKALLGVTTVEEVLKAN